MVFDRIGATIPTACLNLYSQHRDLSAGQTALFKLAEDTGTRTEYLRIEDNEKWRTGVRGGTIE
jgi:hypothetical protein